MQSLEEDALLKGTLAIQGLGSSSSYSSPVKFNESVGGENSPNRGIPRGGRGEGTEGLETDGDETDDYSDQVLNVLHDREP